MTIERRIEKLQSQLLDLVFDCENLIAEGCAFAIIEDIGSHLYSMVDELEDLNLAVNEEEAEDA
jgi:hypothetical protein